MNQHTLADSIVLHGLGVHTGYASNVTLKPLGVNSGVIVKRVDIGCSFPVVADNIVSNNRNTTVGIEACTVQTIEHFMYAFRVLGVTNVLIEVDCEEVPIFDGSAREIVDAINKIGVIDQGLPVKEIVVDKTYVVEENDSRITIEPSDQFELHLTIDFPAKEIGVAEYHYIEGDDFTPISNARTFVLLSELQYLVDSGMSQIDDYNSALIVRNMQPTEVQIQQLMKQFKATREEILYKLDELERVSDGNENYIPYTLVKHKVLDFIGDVNLTNADVKGKFTVYKPGHLVNGKAAKLLLSID